MQAAAQPFWMPSLDALNMLGPMWGLVGTIVAILLAALFFGRSHRISAIVAFIGALVTAWLACRGMAMLDGSNWAGLAPEGRAPMLVADQFSCFFALLVSVFLALITGMWWLGQHHSKPGQTMNNRDAAEFFVLLVGSAFGMTLMVSTTNLLMILLAIEMASLPSYGLAGFRKRNPVAAEASMKYVLFGAVTSAIMIYGVSLLYGQFRTLDLASIATQLSTHAGEGGGMTLLAGVSLFAFLIGAAFKVSAVPFHFWCPDVFEGASIEVTTWLSVVSKAAGLGLVLRVVSVLVMGLNDPQVLSGLTTAIAVVAAITCTVGNYSAFRQENLKRLLAFSSIAHAGYMLMAAAILWHPVGAASGAAQPAFSALASYISVYLFMNLGAFGVVAMVYWATGSETLDAYRGLGRRNTLLAAVMAACLFSLVGLPPLGGFVAKWYLLYALYEGNLVWLIFVAVFNTVISLYYYARVMYAMFFMDSDQPPVRGPLAGQAGVALCALVIVLTGTFWAGGLKRFADDRSRDLYAVVKPTPESDHVATNEIARSTVNE